MPRANRHFIPGMVWHITHRCHKQEFLLKFERDRQRWRHGLFQAKRRYRLTVLNYIVTSNHIHLLVVDNGRGAIAKSIKLIAERTEQEQSRGHVLESESMMTQAVAVFTFQDVTLASCVQLTADHRCAIWSSPVRPRVCGGLQASVDMCGVDFDVAMVNIRSWRG